MSEGASHALARFIGMPPESVQTIYNPFDLAAIERRAEEPLDHPWYVENACPVILAAGRLNEAKDYPVLIRAFAKLRKKRLVRLLIIGEGELRDALEALVVDCGLSEDDVQMPGFVENPYAHMRRCDLFVMSSRREGLPSVLIEAMICGAAVVSTDCPSGPAEILENGVWGQLVPVGDVDALAQAMDTALDTPPAQRPWVRQRAEDFAQERAVEAYLRILALDQASRT